jgi:hypothetical protein
MLLTTPQMLIHFSRTWVTNAGPWLMRVAYWPYKHIETDNDIYTNEEIRSIALRWFPACLALIFLLPTPAMTTVPMYGGKYAPFPYRYWEYPKHYTNIKENRPLPSDIYSEPTPERLLRPTCLAYLQGSQGINVADGDQDPQSGSALTPYIFVAYSTQQFRHENKRDMDALQEMAEHAARTAKVRAFWCSAICMPDAQTVAKDIYRMSDIIRGAESLAIIVKPSDDPTHWQQSGSVDPLVQWGQRMWTFPEALLSPSHKDIQVYTVEGETQSAAIKDDNDVLHVNLETIAKRDFALRAWNDSAEARQLMDHYLGTQVLSRLELAVIAFRCLYRRRVKEQWFQGDLAYALMGLLRKRPKVDATDTEFQAFARLSMANDSDRLLERLICTLPKSVGEHWLTSDDTWDAAPWAIEPMCQVAGISFDDTVILDGCFAAAIEWGGFTQIAHVKRSSVARWAAETLLLRFSSLFAFIFIIVAAMEPQGSSVLPLYVVLIVIFVAIIFASPYLLRVIYGGKFWSTEARLFGFEGYMDAKTIEAHIFGYSLNRFTWSAAGSPLSRHSTNEYGERIGRDPTDDVVVRDIVERAKNNSMGELKIFTIVDTLTMVCLRLAVVV